MDKFREVLANREVGSQIPVSISTALALESVFGVSEEHPEYHKKPPILEYNELWINIRTLHRNLLGAIPTEEKNKALPEPVYEALLSEMQVIESAVEKASAGRCKVTFYLNSYKSLARRYPVSLRKEARTEKQLYQKALEDEVFSKFTPESTSHSLFLGDLDVGVNQGSTMILTHIALDLLSRYHFTKLDLLESHTGALKNYVFWSTKLTGGKELGNLPFNKVTLQIFGDSVHFNTFPTKEKKQVLELAKRDRWSPTTSLDRMKQGIGTYPFHPQFKAILLKMF